MTGSSRFKRASAGLLAVLVVLGLGLSQSPAIASEPSTSTSREMPHPPKLTAADKPQVGEHADKGYPGVSVKKSGATALSTIYRTYAGARKSVTNQGASAYFTVHNPWVSSADEHSIVELAVQNDCNIVEVGWRKDNGGSLKLFTFAWTCVGGVPTPTCYNGCGYVDLASETAYYAGMSLSGVSGSKQFYIEHYNNAWWIAYDQHFIGSWPDSVFSSGVAFTQGDFIQAFAELAGRSTSTACSDMGNGTSPSGSPSSAARMETLHVVYQPVANDTFTTFRDPTGTPASWYNVYPMNTTDTRNFYVGGPMSC